MTDFQSERDSILRDVQADISRTFEEVKSEVDQLVESMDISGVAKKLETFGRERPVALALAALTFGIAAGFLIKNPPVRNPEGIRQADRAV